MNETHHEPTKPEPQPETEDNLETERKPSPAIYVASLADYNNGVLHGKWIDAAREPWEIQADINDILDSSREPAAEEWAIHDYEQFGSWRVQEYDSIEMVSRIAKAIRKHSYGFSAWLSIFDHPPDTFDSFHDDYLGHYDSVEDYVEQMADELGYEAEIDKLPSYLREYVRIDYAAIARDLELSGDIATVRTAACGSSARRSSSGVRNGPNHGHSENAIICVELTNYPVLELQICIDFNQYPIVQLKVQRGAIRMTPEQTVKLIKILTEKRTELGLSSNAVARKAELDPGTVWRIEQGMIAKPRVESLIAIGRVLGINAMELFTAVGWLTADDLPDVSTYLGAKFKGISDSAVEDIEHYVDTTVHASRQYPHRRHVTADAHGCPHKTNHCPQCPCAPKEC